MYATQQDLVKRFGALELAQLTDPDAVLGAIDGERVALALADADHLINGYCGARYVLPLSPVPDVVVRIACDLARYYLHTIQPTDVVTANYKDALRQLADIAAGRLPLQAGAIPTPELEGASVLVEGPVRIFSALGGF